MASPTATEDSRLEEARAFLATRLQAGYDTLDEAIESVVEMLEIDPESDASLVAQIGAVAREELGKIRAELSSWPAVTDNDRLEKAFAQLEAAGIVARENFTCCQTCGHAEIKDEVGAAIESGVDVRGYTFFHEQDTERAIEGGGVMLAYGTVKEDVDPVAIGREIVGALQAAGLEPDWSEEVSKRIAVPLEWRRRSNAALG